jgi:EmrB/QacA subfamily drug resistance transporter
VSDRSWRGLALLVAGAFFMENLDGTIIATAAPSMAASLGVRSVDINITMTAYLLTLAVFIPVSGWIADRFGARSVFGAAIALFTVASALCAISTSLPELTAMRVVQGIGGAMMVPVGRLVVLRSTAKSDLINAIAYLTWPALVAPILAPVLGGVFTTYASWRWIFVVNLPLGAVGLAIALRIVPNVRDAGRPRLDWLGFVLSGGGLALLVYGLERVSGAQIDWAIVGLTVGIGGVLLGIAVAHLLRRDRPLLDLRTMRVQTFRVTNLSGSFFRMAITAVPFLLPLMFQDAFGWGSLKSGLVVIAVFFGNIGIKPFTTRILRRWGFRTVLITMGISASVSLALCGVLVAGTPLVLTALVLFASGVFRSMSFTAYNTITFADIEPAQMTGANTLASTIQQLTMGLGVAVGALALRLGGPLAAPIGLGHSPVAPYHLAFLLIAILPLLALFGSLRLPRDAGAHLSGPARTASRRRSGTAPADA